MISFAVTAKLICDFVFACAKIRFSHDAAHIKCDVFAQVRCGVSSLGDHFVYLNVSCNSVRLKVTLDSLHEIAIYQQ